MLDADDDPRLLMPPRNGKEPPILPQVSQSPPTRGQTRILPEVAVIIVGFHNEADVIGCLQSLSVANASPSFDVFIAENGGDDAWQALHRALAAESSLCQALSEPDQTIGDNADAGARIYRLSRAAGHPETRIHTAQMPDNLGYAGAINAWLRILLGQRGWYAAWILNPDTVPTPSALSELADYARLHKKSMVGSRIVDPSRPAEVAIRGLRWNKIAARTTAVDRRASAAIEPNRGYIEAHLDAASGASLFVTRDLIERIGLMDERYFLYFEDLEWGYRAKALGALGYAHQSVVPHEGGTTIGSANTRAGSSRLSVYLEFRNRILFVRQWHRAWLPWTVLMQTVHVAAFMAAGSFSNMSAAARGLAAGLRGEIGRPDRILKSHRAQGR
jgi:N-acetylglucosaminyl-diphospho-decaprenol L-rhamnosyltransferase